VTVPEDPADNAAGPADEGGEAPCYAHLFEGDNAVSDAVFAQLARELADPLIIADGEGTITFWNGAAERVLGWPAAEAIGATLDVIIPERLRDRHWDGYRKTMATGDTQYAGRLLEVPAQHRDGRTLSVAFTVTLLTRAGESKPFAIAAVLRDDTARWQERRELRAELNKLKQESGPQSG